MTGRKPRHPLGASRPEWAGLLDQAQRQGNAQNLPRPEGLPDDGFYSLNPSFGRNDGTARFYLTYLTHDRKSRTIIGIFEGERKVRTGKQIFVSTVNDPAIPEGQIIELDCGMQVRILRERVSKVVDGRRITQWVPRPVPVVMA